MLREILGNEPNLIIDDGLLPGGQPSTIIKLESDAIAILRTGAYPTDQLGDALMMPVFSAGVAEIPADDSLEAR
jgi:tRNA A37 threonylcarbamoyladenosine synthetase subunit TsaC/SUA5/YrdC